MSIRNRLKALEESLRGARKAAGVFTLRILHATPAGEWGVTREQETPMKYRDQTGARGIDVYIHESRE